MRLFCDGAAGDAWRTRMCICGGGRSAWLHANEPACQSCVITGRNDTAQPLGPLRRAARRDGEGDVAGGIILDGVRLDVFR